MNSNDHSENPHCETFYTRVTPYLWGETSKVETQAINAHRQECDSCEQFFTAAENALCRETYPLVQAYLDRELSAVERQQFERHISVCERCRAHYHFDGRIIRFIDRQIATSPAHEGDVSRLVDVFRDRIRRGAGGS